MTYSISSSWAETNCPSFRVFIARYLVSERRKVANTLQARGKVSEWLIIRVTQLVCEATFLPCLHFLQTHVLPTVGKGHRTWRGSLRKKTVRTGVFSWCPTGLSHHIVPRVSHLFCAFSLLFSTTRLSTSVWWRSMWGHLGFPQHRLQRLLHGKVGMVVLGRLWVSCGCYNKGPQVGCLALHNARGWESRTLFPWTLGRALLCPFLDAHGGQYLVSNHITPIASWVFLSLSGGSLVTRSVVRVVWSLNPKDLNFNLISIKTLSPSNVTFWGTGV